MDRRKARIMTLALAIVLISTGATYAFFTAKSQERKNAFVPGVLSAEIIENGENVGDVECITPVGNGANKKVRIKNIDNPHGIDAYIRTILVPTFRTDEGTLAGDISLNPTGNQITVTASNGATVTLYLDPDWNDHWIYDNGYFYHKEVVHPGKSTGVLLEKVELSDSSLWGNFQLEVLSDAIQTEFDAAASAWGSDIAGQLDEP